MNFQNKNGKNNIAFLRKMESQSDIIDTIFFHFQDPFGENEGKLDYASIKYRLDAIKSRLDEKTVLDDSSSEEDQQQTREENAPEIDDWEAFLYDDD